ncbi:MAG: DUF4870 domain-containing protein [Candidatus Omnitrophota bacterium]
MSEVKELGKTSIGLQANIAGLLCYLVGFISGLIFLILEKENKFVKFHAIQSVVFFGAIWLVSFVLMFIPVLGWIALLLLSVLSFVFWVVLMVKAYQGECFKVPIVGDFAEKKSQA